MKAFILYKTSWYRNNNGTFFSICGIFSTEANANLYMEEHPIPDNDELQETYHLEKYMVDEPDWQPVVYL